MNYALQPAAPAQLASSAVPLVTVAPNSERFDTESTRNRRIYDAKQYRLKSGSADLPTMKFTKRDLEQVWLKIASEATQASHYFNSQRSIDLWDRAAKCASNSRQLAFSLSQMAGIYYQRKNYVKAEPLALRAVSEYQNDETIGRIELAKALSNVAIVYHAMNRLHEAAVYYEQSLDIRLETLPMDDPIVVSSLYDYKRCLRDANLLQNPLVRTTPG